LLGVLVLCGFVPYWVSSLGVCSSLSSGFCLGLFVVLFLCVVVALCLSPVFRGFWRYIILVLFGVVPFVFCARVGLFGWLCLDFFLVFVVVLGCLYFRMVVFFFRCALVLCTLGFGLVLVFFFLFGCCWFAVCGVSAFSLLSVGLVFVVFWWGFVGVFFFWVFFVVFFCLLVVVGIWFRGCLSFFFSRVVVCLILFSSVVPFFGFCVLLGLVGHLVFDSSLCVCAVSSFLST